MIFLLYKETVINEAFRNTDPGKLGIFLVGLAVFKLLSMIGITILGYCNITKHQNLGKSALKSYITISYRFRRRKQNNMLHSLVSYKSS